jgi:hypothetical protein
MELSPAIADNPVLTANSASELITKIEIKETAHSKHRFCTKRKKKIAAAGHP